MGASPNNNPGQPQPGVQGDAGRSPNFDGGAVEPTPPGTEVPTGCTPSRDGDPQPFLCPCDTNADCESGYCLAGAQGKVCTKNCIEDCPSGFECGVLVGTCPDCAQVCIPSFVTLCDPCNTNAECRNPYFEEAGGARCVRHGDAGNFCGAGCNVDEDCPEGLLCDEVEAVDGAMVKQCVQESGFCGCSALASDKGAETTCSVTNDLGSCSGTRACASESLTACDAQVPQAEECDGLDNDCDGLLDEGSCQGNQQCNCNDQGCACGCAPGEVDCGSGCVDVMTSAAHCGDCGAPCDADNVGAFVCVDGVCGIAKCAAGFEDKDGAAENGCECSVQPEICDGLDNDCDGQIDEGGDLCSGVGGCGGVCAAGQCTCEEGCDACQGTCMPTDQYNSDTNNCGGCGNACELSGTAIHKCEAGQCKSILCADGFKDCNMDQLDGCEWTVEAEICDGVDNDCDGIVDEKPLADCDGAKVCENGYCQCPADQPDLFDCPELGCKNLANDKEHCGSCGYSCADNEWQDVQGYSCVDGACAVKSCAATFFDVDGDPYNGCECEKTSPIELCDGIDNDCDGEIDEGPLADCKGAKICEYGSCICDPKQANLMLCGDGDSCSDVGSSIDHCGFCGNTCGAMGLPNVSKYKCGQGNCELSQCQLPFVDADKDLFNGCECEKTSTVETCDGVDNDCDGTVDEGPNNCKGGQLCQFGECACPFDKPHLMDCGTGTCIDTMNDKNNCGMCGNVCNLPGAAYQKCEEGQCVVPACKPGLKDCNESAFDGCEWTVEPEMCDFIDNDCDGEIDEQPKGINVQCESTFPGLCKLGKTVCAGGNIECQPNIQPGSKPEVCNGQDEDCDGIPDNGDPGGGAPCMVPGAKGACAQGVRHCQNGSLVCEQVVFPGAEVCDGQDNDCDGQVDGMQQSCFSDCGSGTETCQFGSWNGCNAQKPKTCQNWNSCSTEQMCVTSCPPKPVEMCDGVDNNCNAAVDEGFTCKPGQTQTQKCDGACGTKTRTCTNSCSWGNWSSCQGAGVCQPGAKQTKSCGSKCGKQTRTCNSQCKWNNYSKCGSEGVCSPGSKKTKGCTQCGEQTATCNSQCKWNSYGSCKDKGVCNPNQTKSCTTGCGKQTCSSSCGYGSCKYTTDKYEGSSGNGSTSKAKFLGTKTEGNSIASIAGTVHKPGDVDYYKFKFNEKQSLIDWYWGWEVVLSGGAGSKTLQVIWDRDCNGKNKKYFTASGGGKLTVNTGNLDVVGWQNGCIYVKVTSSTWSCNNYTLGFTIK